MATTPTQPYHRTHRVAPHSHEGGHRTQLSSQPFGPIVNIAFAFGYLQSDKFQSARPPDDKQSPKTSSRPPDDEWSHELCGRISKIPKDNLTVLLLGRLRRETPTAEEATKNSRPGARTRARTSAGISRNPAR